MHRSPTDRRVSWSMGGRRRRASGRPPFLRGPRQMTASSGLGSMKPMLITPRFSCEARQAVRCLASQSCHLNAWRSGSKPPQRGRRGAREPPVVHPAAAGSRTQPRSAPNGGCVNSKPTCTYTGDQPAPDWWISSPSRPSILGTEGPQMSISSSPTCSRARQKYPGAVLDSS